MVLEFGLFNQQYGRFISNKFRNAKGAFAEVEARRAAIRAKAEAEGRSVFFSPNPFIQGGFNFRRSQEYLDYLKPLGIEVFQDLQAKVSAQADTALAISPAESFLQIQESIQSSAGDPLTISDTSLPDF